MREVLFRGKKLKDGNWTFGYIFDDGTVESKRIFVGGLVVTDSKGTTSDAYEVGIDFCEVDPTTVGQYTGLTDKNGVKIFEGDIVLVDDSMESTYLFEVKFGDCGGVKNVEHKVGYVGFYFNVITDSKWIKSSLRKDPIYFLSDLGCEAKVIGNIHDNPELLK